VALNAPKPDEGPSGVRGNRDEAMTVRQLNLYGYRRVQSPPSNPICTRGIIFVMLVEGLKGRDSILDARPCWRKGVRANSFKARLPGEVM